MAQLNAGFSASATSGCTNLAVNFTDQSTGGPTSWFWDFGNGITSTDKNPGIIYTEGGRYTVRLIVKNALEQDYEEKINYIQVYKTPGVGFISNVSSGCTPLSISFTDTTNLSGIDVQNRIWDFGDGATSDLVNPSHTYISNGKFDISLTVQTTQGCINTYKKISAIKTGAKPAANFKATPLDGCAAELRQFKNTSTGYTSSSWNFGDRTTSTETSPEHHYHDTGWFSVSLIVSNNGCPDTIIKNNYLHVKGPASSVYTYLDCDDPYLLKFSAAQTPGASYEWNLGDGVTSTDRTITHTYAAAGSYMVKLKVDDGSCYDTASSLIYISSAKLSAALSPAKPFYCKNESITFKFINVDSAALQNFRWNFGNGDSLNFNKKNQSVAYAYDTNGNYKPVAFANYVNGCKDTFNLNAVKVAGPTAAFSNIARGCTNTAVTFTDRSAADGAPINNWLWSYGDGTITAGTKPFTNTYIFPGLYNIDLTVTDANGCVDSVAGQINIEGSPEVEAFNDTTICVGESAQLTATGANTLAWAAGENIICNPCSVPPVVLPTVNTTYYVKGTNEQGCYAIDSALITVQARTPVSALPADTAICAGSPVQLSVTGATKYKWSPAEGLSSTVLPNPVAVPMVSTSYKVINGDSGACPLDSAVVNITVNQLPTIDISGNDVTLPVGSSYQIQTAASADVQTWQWSPPVNLSCYTCPNPVATMIKPLTYSVTVLSNNGCRNADSIRLLPVCTNDIVFVPNTFSPNNDGMNDYFFPNSKILLTVKNLIIMNRWGQKVFERNNFQTNNAANGWNGRVNNKEVGAGVYVYIMQLECSDGSIINLKGNISLLR